MTLNCDDYRLSFVHVNNILRQKSDEERFSAIGAIAVATGVPIIVVAHYYGELYGLTDKLYAFIERLKTFYHVTEVLNVRS